MKEVACSTSLFRNHRIGPIRRSLNQWIIMLRKDTAAVTSAEVDKRHKLSLSHVAQLVVITSLRDTCTGGTVSNADKIATAAATRPTCHSFLRSATA